MGEERVWRGETAEGREERRGEQKGGWVKTRKCEEDADKKRRGKMMKMGRRG